MLAVDTQRLIIFALMLLSGYWVWHAWQEDYNPPVQPKVSAVPAEQQSVVASNPNAINAKAEMPELSQQASQQMPETQQTVVEELFTVKTDLIEAEINLNGGDIQNLRLLKNYKDLDSKEPFQLLTNSSGMEYVAQSGLISNNGPDTPQGQRFKLALPSGMSLEQVIELQAGQDELIVPLIWTDENGIQITKRFIFKRDSFTVGVEYLVDNQSQQAWQGVFYGQLKRKDLGRQGGMLGTVSFSGAAISSPEQKYEKFDYSDLANANIDRQVEGGWLAYLQHYFITAWVPNPEHNVKFYSNSLGNGYYRIGFTESPLYVQPGEQKTIGAKLFAGTKEQVRLKALAPHLELSVDYGWLWPISMVLFWLLKKIYAFVGNWGWAIIIVTFLVKALFFKLSATSYRSMAKMRKVQPKLQDLKERYGDDRQAMSQAMMRLYKEEKINPLGGCLPILVQIPVFIALYWVLLESVELRHADFIWWLDDLSSKDPFYVLPVLMGVSMFAQQMLNPAPMDPMHAKIMKVLPILFTFFFMVFPAGLVLYWVVSNVLSILQQWIITRVIMKES